MVEPETDSEVCSAKRAGEAEDRFSGGEGEGEEEVKSPSAAQTVPSSAFASTTARGAPTELTAHHGAGPREGHEEVLAVVRRRRNLSKRLTFLTVELLPQSDNMDTTPVPSFQFMCQGWEVPRNIANGVSVRATGRWEAESSKGLRFLVAPNGVSVLHEAVALPRSLGWKQAADHAAWRARSAKVICSCTDLACSKWHSDPVRWAERKQLQRVERLSKQKTAPVSVGQSLCEVGCVDGHSDESPAAKSKHNFIFASWILQTFPESVLQGGVADIAGGRGLIALQLALEHHLRVVLIEPKELKLNSTHRRRIKKFWRQLGTCPAATSVPSSVDTTGGRVHCHEEHHQGNLKLPLLHLREEFFGVDSAASTAVREALGGCELLIAMHPDSATGAVVESALALRKPFAVVPCCVFSYMFPDRQTPNGKTVATYDEFLDYLEALGSGMVKRAQLPFEGRNVVLYCIEYDDRHTNAVTG
uniref:Methyltransferase domain-containing protein n=1 Tax=Chromera velia CCMP2878 TaxID=1169474 RepID=A0A0G4FCJ6_9ALVE|eukprot:Cvel_16345.t1-p1 / transcript=Cvel_16345.t1 / gene=Cvel_16345 / organism=Chromera_velia_CCMP2878 / gene_product=hypothetical protein / transcript_product=hypothetical protein / location=Cvel_scaffold1255:634-2052(-) / protein_length=473 / sequence_SO=supercontig / SO=protein_coding / is_pseudo=false